MSDGPLVDGLIVAAQSGWFEVETPQGLVTAQLRGRLKEARAPTDLAALGDRVTVRLLEQGRGSIERVGPRTSVLSRQDPAADREQVIVANPDQVFFVMACADPPPNPRMLDRLLVAAEREHIPASICANKLDLVDPVDRQQPLAVYERLGYPVFYVSARTGAGVDQLRARLAGRINVFAGPSGVGKTSLLNAIQPGLALRTGEVRARTRKGRHTTVELRLVRLESGGYVADTPGVKAFALWDIEPEELDAYFPEIRDRVAECEFSDCSHLHEPGCAVLKAVEDGGIDPERYDSYRRMRLGEE
jgi:ribosome biogenesis GTPase / thiamine phosphate phosphatase